jgi:hypothetical protein
VCPDPTPRDLQKEIQKLAQLGVRQSRRIDELESRIDDAETRAEEQETHITELEGRLEELEAPEGEL